MAFFFVGQREYLKGLNFHFSETISQTRKLIVRTSSRSCNRICISDLNWILAVQEMHTRRSRHDTTPSNINKCFGFQLKFHDISWWFVRIFLHERWSFIYSKRKKVLPRLHLWNVTPSFEFFPLSFHRYQRLALIFMCFSIRWHWIGSIRWKLLVWPPMAIVQ